MFHHEWQFVLYNPWNIQGSTSKKYRKYKKLNGVIKPWQNLKYKQNACNIRLHRHNNKVYNGPFMFLYVKSKIKLSNDILILNSINPSHKRKYQLVAILMAYWKGIKYDIQDILSFQIHSIQRS